MTTIDNGVAGYEWPRGAEELDFVHRHRRPDRAAQRQRQIDPGEVLADHLALMEGEMRHSAKLKFGYFAQHQADELDLSSTPYAHMAAIIPMATETKVYAHLGHFGFGAEPGRQARFDPSGRREGAPNCLR